jgi:hypothetical protein
MALAAIKAHRAAQMIWLSMMMSYWLKWLPSYCGERVIRSGPQATGLDGYASWKQAV